MQHPFDFSGQTAVVTGGNRGIGQAVVERFLESGAQVVVLDLSPKKNSPKNALFYACNVADEIQVFETLSEVTQKFSNITTLINNAGITDDAVIWKMTSEQWQRVLAVNLTGAFHTIKFFAPYFRERQHGAIVNISSINGMRGKFGQANYAASKGGLISLTKTVARELGRFQVTVNAIAPGMVQTEMVSQLDPEVISQAASESVLGKIAQPQDIAHAVLFLCSRWARHITGTVLKVDGGQYI